MRCRIDVWRRGYQGMAYIGRNITSYYMVFVNSPSDYFSLNQRRAAPSLDFPGPQNNSQIRVHPLIVESHHTSYGLARRAGAP